MLQRRVKFIAMPIAILFCAALAGYIVSLTLAGVHFNPDMVSFSSPELTPTLDHLRNPFVAIVLLYALWNGYHFGMQNFGVMSIYRRKYDLNSSGVLRGGITGKPVVHAAHNSNCTLEGVGEPCGSREVTRFGQRPELGRSQRRIDQIYCCGVTWAVMLMPFIPRFGHGLHDAIGWPASPAFIPYVRPTYFALASLAVGAMMWREVRFGTCVPRQILILTDGLAMILIWFAGLWGFAILSLNHWLVAIGLAAHVHANDRRRASTLPFALTLIILGLAVFAMLFIRHAAPSPAMLGFTVTAVGLRLGLGFVHFLYDRWIYKLSNPRVRATIGKDIFPPIRELKA
jgi:type IV secretory pathway TrbD component